MVFKDLYVISLKKNNSYKNYLRTRLFSRDVCGTRKRSTLSDVATWRNDRCATVRAGLGRLSRDYVMARFARSESARFHKVDSLQPLVKSAIWKLSLHSYLSSMNFCSACVCGGWWWWWWRLMGGGGGRGEGEFEVRMFCLYLSVQDPQWRD